MEAAGLGNGLGSTPMAQADPADMSRDHIATSSSGSGHGGLGGRGRGDSQSTSGNPVGHQQQQQQQERRGGGPIGRRLSQAARSLMGEERYDPIYWPTGLLSLKVPPPRVCWGSRSLTPGSV